MLIQSMRTVVSPKTVEMDKKWPGHSQLVGKTGLILGPGYQGAAVTLCLITSLSLLCMLIPCRYFLTEKDQPAPIIISGFLAFLALLFFALTATTNPGFIPRQNSRFSQGPEQTPMLGSTLLEYEGRTRDIPLRGCLQRLRYCRTCKPHFRLPLPSAPSLALPCLRRLCGKVRSSLSVGGHVCGAQELPLLLWVLGGDGRVGMRWGGDQHSPHNSPLQ